MDTSLPSSKPTPETIRSLFGTIARRYDLGNGLLSLGLHQHWNRRLIRAAAKSCPEGPLLDLCAGTGAIGIGYLRDNRLGAQAHLLDFCPEMLSLAKERARAHRLEENCTFLEADAHVLPFESASFGVVTMAYGIRNLANPLQCAKEVRRVLKPGGQWLILELTRPNWSILRVLHGFYLRKALPLIGGLISGNRGAYAYLAKSIQGFAAPTELAASFASLGFTPTAICPLAGGIATLTALQA